MCTAGDTPDRGRRQGGDELERELVGEENAALALSPDLDDDTATARIADADEAERARIGTEDEIHVEYLQISDEPSGETAMEEENDVEEVPNGDPPLVNGGGLSGGQSDGIGGSLQSGYVVSEGRRAGEKVVTVNGMQFHVFGNVSGLELLGSSPAAIADLNLADSDEEEEEQRRRVEGERAIAEANEADAARRSAPIPPENRVRIVNAMKGINLGGYRPAWADAVPEDQWISKMKESATNPDTK